jgi:hypothetical protein
VVVPKPKCSTSRASNVHERRRMPGKQEFVKPREVVGATCKAWQRLPSFRRLSMSLPCEISPAFQAKCSSPLGNAARRKSWWGNTTFQGLEGLGLTRCAVFPTGGPRICKQPPPRSILIENETDAMVTRTAGFNDACSGRSVIRNFGRAQPGRFRAGSGRTWSQTER